MKIKTKEMKERILEEYKKGNIVVLGIEGLKAIPIKEFINQPTEGMLYDLNRNESVMLSFLDDPKWVNDYAVAKVIIELKNRIKELESKHEQVDDLILDLDKYARNYDPYEYGLPTHDEENMDNMRNIVKLRLS